MNTIKRVNFIFERKDKIRMIFLLVIIGFGALLELVGVGIILPFVNVVLNAEVVLKNKYAHMVYKGLGFSSTDNFIVFLALFIVVIYILKNIYVYMMHSVIYRFTYSNQKKLSLRMMKCYMRQPYLYHLNHNSAELSRNINEDVTSFFEAILAGLQLIAEGGVCVLLLGFLFHEDKSITLGIMALGVVFVYVYIKYFRKKLRNEGVKKRECEAMTRQYLLEALGSIKEIKVLEREIYFIASYERSYKEFTESQRKFKVYSIIPKPVMEVVCISGLMLVVIFKLLRGVSADYFVPTLSVFAVAAFRMLPSFNRIAEYSSRMMFNKPAVDAVYHDLKEIEILAGERKDLKGSGEVPVFEKEIRVEDVCFHYPDVSKNVLDHVSFVIPKNKSVALIGPSGQGKTTLADVLLGILEPQDGTVRIDGVDVCQCVEAWHEKLGYIPQTIALLDATIKDNITFGMPRERVNEARLNEALKEAQLKEFVDSLEEGLETRIGERGVRLSGGQRQRIGIARALYNNPEILVLDEATSALDNETEAAVMEAINNLAGKKTLIIIAHRLTTIRNCDLIFEVNGGSIMQRTEPLPET